MLFATISICFRSCNNAVASLWTTSTKQLSARLCASLYCSLQMLFGVCYGGGGPENVLLVVNQNSLNSLTVANHYKDLRKIPSNHIVYIPYRGSKIAASGETLRKRILTPIFEAIKLRQLGGQIDYIVYSTDFPWRIDLTKDYPGKKFPPQLTPRGSLTGLTYLSSFVMQKREEIVGLGTNLYFADSKGGVTFSREFKSKYRWEVGGRRTSSVGRSYYISSMLGVTDGRGNTIPCLLYTSPSPRDS